MGLTQEAFAELCDVSRASIARYDSGAAISRKNAEKIASACHISIDELLGYHKSVDNYASDPELVTLSPVETQIIVSFRHMTKRGKQRVIETLEELGKLYEVHTLQE